VISCHRSVILALVQRPFSDAISAGGAMQKASSARGTQAAAVTCPPKRKFVGG